LLYQDPLAILINWPETSLCVA